MANKAASTFDGSNDYFTRTAALSGAVDSKKATISCWFKVSSAAYTQYVYTIYTGATTYFYLRFTTSGYVQVYGKDAAGNIVVYVDSSTSGWTNGAWHHVMISFDNSQAQPEYLHFYIDGVNRLGTVNTWTSGDIKWSNQYSTFGSYHTGGLIAGDISEFWMSPGLYTDLSIASERRRFYGGAKAPIVTAVGLATPILYFPNGDAASNSGSGGNYTAVGAIAAATGPEIIYNVPIIQNSYGQRRN